MKQLLIPTDFSENAWQAMEYGMELFKNTKCVFHILHIDSVMEIMEDDEEVFTTAGLMEDIAIKESMSQMQLVLQRIKRLPPNANHSFVTNVVYAFLVESIRKEIVDKKIDLIIMGTKGGSGLRKFTLGSNTGDVMTKVKCPLLIVPKNARYIKPIEIAFATDFRVNYSINVLDALTKMVHMNKATLRIVYVFGKQEALSDQQNENKEILHDYLKEIPHSFQAIQGKNIETSLQEYVKSHGINMIAMVAKNLNFLQRILFRPTVKEISYHTHIPFLVLHE
ncbi:universal stress protein [Arenibacter sp. 6A1]|uniref:universal stress protein n=1 Tax=Arenibacter sp. 6A1 TaxID=2720391 RepID=UPI00144678CC|nr:universal stress protein [Arenibacter sp. 6A1]NKI25747.1 universal stress protein [Arenibacter sp. 6A1]